MAGQKTPMRGDPGRYGDRAKTGFILFIAAALCITCFSVGCSKKKEQPKAEKVSNVKVWAVEKKTVRPSIDTIGSLNPNDEVIISSEVDGILKDIPVDEGTPVTKGTILARVDDTDYRLATDTAQAAVRQAEANLTNLTTEKKRKEALFKEELVTSQQFDDVSTRLTVAARDLDRAKFALSLTNERLGKSTICSPIKGIVKERKVTAGDFVRAGMPILTIVQIDPLKLSFTITEKDVGSLKTGQDVAFMVDPFPNREFKGTLSIIYPNLDERTRSLKAEAITKNPSLELKPGFFARVKVYTSLPKEAVVIPINSILYEGTRVRVFLREGNIARERSIKIGEKYGDMMEVLEGLYGGESLIVVGQNNLTDGVKINVVK
jgi:membrane fusion protein, multidrug efflux system